MKGNYNEFLERALTILGETRVAKKDFQKAFEYSQQLLTLKDSISSAAKKRAVAELQVRFETQLKEQEITDLKQKNKIQDWLILAISFSALIIIVAFWLLYRHNRLRNKLLTQEKNQLNEAKRTAEEIHRLQQEKLRAEIEYKNRTLASNALYLLQKNELLETIDKRFQKISPASDDLAELQKLLRSNLSLDEAWENFKLHFEQVHPRFFERLLENFPELSPSELKLCAYIKINLSAKEIAQLLNINAKSVEMSRYRLRKKMDLPEETSLTDFIRSY